LLFIYNIIDRLIKEEKKDSNKKQTRRKKRPEEKKDSKKNRPEEKKDPKVLFFHLQTNVLVNELKMKYTYIIIIIHL
jgi:hypothetical protein